MERSQTDTEGHQESYRQIRADIHTDAQKFKSNMSNIE